MPGAEWKSYLNVADHPEYPSGSGCFCSAHAQAARRLEGGSDQFNILWPIMQGSSKVEPGITPHETMFLYWPTWTAYVEDCKMSRVYGGVHFLATQEDSVELCSQFGDMAYEFTMDLINGKVKGK
jgi:hypothetical protein